MSLYDLIANAGATSFVREQAAVMNNRLDRVTEQRMRETIGKGAGWKLWRSNPESEPGDAFKVVWHFQFVAPDAPPPGAGVLFEQPELTDGERARIVAGRHDWREQAWQDECGVPDCGHKCCEDYRHGR